MCTTLGFCCSEEAVLKNLLLTIYVFRFVLEKGLFRGKMHLGPDFP